MEPADLGMSLKPEPEQWRLARLSLIVLGVLWALSTIGTAFSLYLVNHQPLVLVALSPIGRHVLLGAAVANPAALLVVATVRRLLFYTAMFFLGRALGPAAIGWIEARARYLGRFVRWVEQVFERAPRAVVLVAAGPTVSALAGMSGMRIPTYLGLATVSTAARLAIWIAFAEQLREPIEWLLAWIDRYWIPGTVLMVAVVAAFQWRRIRAAQSARAAAEG